MLLHHDRPAADWSRKRPTQLRITPNRTAQVSAICTGFKFTILESCASFVISASRPLCVTVRFSATAMFARFNSKEDRRRRKRQLINTSVRVITKFGSIDAIGINISEGGMGLFTVAHLPVGSRVEVEFRTADGPTSFMRLPATIRHRALYLYGVEFDAVRDQDRPGRNNGKENKPDSISLQN